MENSEVQQVVEAIHDLTRVIIALDGGFENKAATIRKLDAIGISTGRISAIMGVPSKDVSSTLNHARKKDAKQDE